MEMTNIEETGSNIWAKTIVMTEKKEIMTKYRIKIIYGDTKLMSMTINGIVVESELDRLEMLKAIHSDRPDIMEIVWDSVVKSVAKTYVFRWNGMWEDGKDYTGEVGEKQYLLRMCINCGKRMGMHYSKTKKCPEL